MSCLSPVRRRESGYAVLMIFLVAAVLALTMYQAMPRVVFEAERDKEQLLIDRGEQYKRAIQLYYRKTGRYPVKMEDLENTNNLRFLRQRYKDPMTGKDEWRLIHVGPGGVFIDSLTQKKTDPNKKAATQQTFITELGAIGDTGTGAAEAVNPGLRRRPSDGGGPGGSDPNSPFPPDPFTPGNNAGMTPGGVATVGDPGLIGPGNSVVPGGNQFNNQQNNQLNGQNTGFNPGAPPPGAPGASPSGTNAAAMIGQMLTGPRPGGPPPGIMLPSNAGGDNNPFPAPSNPTNAMGGGSTFGGGSTGPGTGNSGAGQVLAGSFAGVASTAEKPSIKVYNDRKKFNEWEFIYDYSKDLAKAVGLPVNPGGAGNPSQPGQLGQPGQPSQPSQPSQPTQPSQPVSTNQ